MSFLDQDKTSREALPEDQIAAKWWKICIAVVVVLGLLIVLKVGAMLLRPMRNLNRTYNNPLTETYKPPSPFNFSS